MTARKGLGKGLDTLIPQKVDSVRKDDDKKKDKFNTTINEIFLNINDVEPNRNQPRKDFDEDALIELSESIKQFGIIAPLVVQKRDKYYEIIAGERRWRAAKMAGIKEIPVVIKEYNEQEILVVSLIENIQRENLNPIEEALALKRLLNEFNLKQDEVAERVSKSRTAVTNTMRLLKLSETVQQMVIDDMISTGHARALLAITEESDQISLANRIFDEKLSVRETEKLVKDFNTPKVKNEPKPKEQMFVYQNLEDQMKSKFGSKVVVKSKTKEKGKIEIDYYSQGELERIFEMIMSIVEE